MTHRPDNLTPAERDDLDDLETSTTPVILGILFGYAFGAIVLGQLAVEGRWGTFAWMLPTVILVVPVVTLLLAGALQ